VRGLNPYTGVTTTTHPTATARARAVSVVEIAHRPRDGTSLLAARIPSPDFVPFVRFGPEAPPSSCANALPGVSRRALLWPGCGRPNRKSVSAASAATRPSDGITAE
jgi:hypothetical protein